MKEVLHACTNWPYPQELSDQVADRDSAFENPLGYRHPLDQQELVVKPIVYWDGALRGADERDGRQVSGDGYMELTGYSGALRGMVESPALENRRGS